MGSSVWRALAAGSVVLTGVALVAPHANATETVTLNLVVTNDFHGQIDSNTVQFAGTVRQLLDDAPAENSLFLSGGDNVGESSPASSAQNDNPTIDMFNLLGLDVSAAGNHEFDQGYDDLVNHLQQRAHFPFLAANVTKADGSPALPASAMFAVGGLKLAVIGAVTDTTPTLLDPSGVAGLTFSDPVAAVNREADRLDALPRRDRPDVIIASLHEGAPWGTWALDQAKGESAVFKHIVDDTSAKVDALITAHTHNHYAWNAPVPGDPSRTRPVLQSGFYGQQVGQITLAVDPQSGEVTASSVRNVERVTTSDAELIASDPTLAQIAALRDSAVLYAQAHAGEIAAAQAAFDTSKASADAAYTDAETAKAAYEATLPAVESTYAVATDKKARYEADAAACQTANARALDIKKQYDALMATASSSYSKALELQAAYKLATSNATTSYATATSLYQQYTSGLAAGKLPTAPDMVALLNQYNAAIAATKDYTAQASSLLAQYNTAIAATKDARAQADALLPAYQAALADAKAPCDAAAASKAEYDAALADWQAALATRDQAKADYDAAVATWQEQLALYESAKTTLISVT